MYPQVAQKRLNDVEKYELNMFKASFKEYITTADNKNDVDKFRHRVAEMIKIKKAEDQDAKINEAVAKAKKRLI